MNDSKDWFSWLVLIFEVSENAAKKLIHVPEYLLKKEMSTIKLAVGSKGCNLSIILYLSMLFR